MPYQVSPGGSSIDGKEISALFPLPVVVRLEKREAFEEIFGKNWETKSLFALFLEDAFLTGKIEDLKAFPCQWDPLSGLMRFEAGQEGDFLFICLDIPAGEKPEEKLLREVAKTLLL